jgi:hypothetical protein
MAPIDSHGRQVLDFQLQLRNAGKVGAYADLLVKMYESKSWRVYTTGTRTDTWRAHEFDYFLIAQEAEYADVYKILLDTKVKAAKIAEAMTGDPSSAHRRSLEEVAKAWNGPGDLLAMARKQGWTTHTQALKRPVSRRQRFQLDSGMTQEQATEQHRREMFGPQRVATLKRLIEQICTQTKDTAEIRYIANALLRSVRGRKSRRPHGNT